MLEAEGWRTGGSYCIDACHRRLHERPPHAGCNLARARVADEVLHGVLRHHHLQRAHAAESVAYARHSRVSVLLHFSTHRLQINATECLQEEQQE